MKKIIIATSVMLVLLVAVSHAVAWGPAGNLNLTAEQSEKLNGLHQGFLKETLPIQNELASKALEFRTLLASPSTDKTQVKAKQQEMFVLQNKMQEKSLAYRLDAREILTPDQISMLPPGCGLGFAAGAGYGRGTGYGKGRGGGMGYGKGYGRGMGRGRGGRGPGFCAYGRR